MQDALNHFCNNINYVKNLGTIYVALKETTTGALDLSDILRAEFVLSVSAFDFFIHEIVEIGMKETYLKKRPPTDKFLVYDVPLRSFWQDPSILVNHDWFIEEVRIKHSFKSFQRPDNIADAIRLISDVKLWDEVGNIMNSNGKDVKDHLSLIIDRRNKIAHEADTNPTTPGSRWSIDKMLVDDAIKFIEDVANSMYNILKI